MSDMRCVTKLIGGDLELGNFILGENEAGVMSDFEASRLLLTEIEGFPLRQQRSAGYSINGGSGGLYGSYDFGDIYGRSSATSTGAIEGTWWGPAAVVSQPARQVAHARP